jgi:PTS system nitrogen regulatory IIA component
VLNRLATILDAGDVEIDAEARDKPALFARAGSILARGEAGCAATIAETLAERERLASTALGHGVAIPHGRIKGLKAPRAAVIRLREALPFGAPDDAPASLFVFLLVGEHATEADLATLAEIAGILSERALRAKLMQAPDARVLYAMIAGWRPDRAA